MGMIGQLGGAVIALKEYRNMRHDPRIQQVIGYWEALRAGRPAPLRAEVDPRGIEGALDRVFLAERIAPGIGRIRLAGMGLNDLVGMEVRGMPLTALIAPGDRETFAEALERVFAGGVRCTLRLSARRSLSRAALDGELVLLPLMNDRRGSPLVLGCLTTTGQIGRTPRRLEVTEVHHEPFTITAPAATPALPPAKAPAAARVEDQPGFSEPAAPAYVPSPPQPAGRPALRLVKSDR